MDLDTFPNPFEDETPQATPEVTPQAGEPVLTDEMKAFIDKEWKTMDLMEMTRHIFKNDNLKGSSREGRVVRSYLIAKGFAVKTTARTKEEVILTEEHKEFCLKYASSMKPYEMARVIFKNEKLFQMSKEALAVQTFIKASSPALLKRDDEYTEDEYLPPKTFSKMLKRINEVTTQNIEEDKINVRYKKAIESCVNFVQTPRFVLTVNNLKNISERTIFESEYIRSVWDKPDLTTDEINLYISLVNEYVIQDRLHRIMAKLNMLLENVTEDREGKISMGLADALKGKSEELNQSLNRQLKFSDDLGGKRSERQEKKDARAKSLVSLVEAFRDEAERENAIRIAEFRKKKVADEIHRLENESEWDARIFGITQEEILE